MLIAILGTSGPVFNGPFMKASHVGYAVERDAQYLVAYRLVIAPRLVAIDMLES